MKENVACTELRPDDTLDPAQGGRGLILIDSAFAPVGYNAEAIRILTYPLGPAENHQRVQQIEAKLRSLLVPFRYSRRASRMLFQSGRRYYGVRIFELHNHRRTSAASSSRYHVRVVLLERLDRKRVDLVTVSQRFNLTPREQEALGLLLEGLTSKEIAGRMAISPHTVKTFLRLVMSKMQVSSRSAIIGKIIQISG
jgi:DNA-binding CsgD family transcriptional regulator